ncbi:hypothetical protein HRbin15_02144 [bacterium HR15]|nr:hypothetical protein HRbin15_02144 [bacterium HR15]
MMRKLAFWLCAAALGVLMVALSGCGGGTNSETRAGSVGIFVTDQFHTQYSQVVFTLYRIEVGRQGDPNSFQTVFEESSGLALDVRALANLAQFLGVGSLPAGVYNRARITVADKIQVTHAGSTTATLDLDAGLGRPVGSGQLQFEFPIQLTVVASGNTTLIVDFDLPSFSIVNGLVRPALRHLRDDELGNRRREAELSGTITALAENSFTLQLRNGRVVQVQTSAQTVITSESGNTSTLAVGQRVKVYGAVNPVDLTITALRVKIKDLDEDDGVNRVEVKGIVTQIGERQFTLRLLRARQFTPQNAALTITYTSGTRWIHDEGQIASPDQLRLGMEVEVKGTLSSPGEIQAVLIELEIEED